MKRRDFLKFAFGASGLLVAEQLIQPAKLIFDYGAVSKRQYPTELGKYKVYYDDGAYSKECRYKGKTTSDAGMFYCPYIPVQFQIPRFDSEQRVEFYL